MRALVLNAASDRTVRAQGELLALGVGSGAGQRVMLAREIRQFLAGHISYLDDPLTVELVRRPVDMLEEIDRRYFLMGDCDDIATLGAALGVVVGLRPRFVAVSFPSAPDNFAHVWTELETAPGVWTELDFLRDSGDYDLSYISRRLVMDCLSGEVL